MNNGNIIAKHQVEYDEYIKAHDVYHRQPDCDYNLLELSHYINENKLSGDKITEEVLEKFRIKN